ncbi:MAG: hypothetical protein ABL958_07605 [Bdellovibrionia bacterium]
MFLLLAAFFVSCTAKAEEKPEIQPNPPVEVAAPSDPLKMLDLTPSKDEKKHPRECTHFCKIDLSN